MIDMVVCTFSLEQLDVAGLLTASQDFTATLELICSSLDGLVIFVKLLVLGSTTQDGFK